MEGFLMYECRARVMQRVLRGLTGFKTELVFYTLSTEAPLNNSDVYKLDKIENHFYGCENNFFSR